MLLLTLIMLICRILSAKTIKQGSPNACNVDSSSIKADETNMCGATKFDVIEVSHASHCGETVPQVDTENPPTIRWINAKPETSYTVVMVDPDAPPKHAGKVWVHWILYGVKGDALAKNEKIKGKIVDNFDFYPPTPPPHTGRHRYQIFVFESPGQNMISSQTRRDGFSLVQFVSENHICKLSAKFQYQVNPPS